VADEPERIAGPEMLAFDTLVGLVDVAENPRFDDAGFDGYG